jgi:drug/metabolite transporter (DMT)-like permease
MAYPAATPASGNTLAWLAAPLHLLGVGILLAVTVLFSKFAALAGAPMLWFLALVFGGAGGILFLWAWALGRLGGARGFLGYSAVAGILAAVPSALGYLSVAHVGAGYVSLTFAFPVLLTFLIALPLGIERASLLKLAAIAAALAGGVILALGKASAEGGSALWTLLASSIPLWLALGNIYRTRFWPKGADALPLAALALLAGAAAASVAAFAAESPAGLSAALPLVGAGALVLAAQYFFQFRLQRLAGPVYMSQIGSVAAVAGAALAVFLLGEALPSGFWPAAFLIALGAAGFQAARRFA